MTAIRAVQSITGGVVYAVTYGTPLPRRVLHSLQKTASTNNTNNVRAAHYQRQPVRIILASQGISVLDSISTLGSTLYRSSVVGGISTENNG